jgi:hypothetical protein
VGDGSVGGGGEGCRECMWLNLRSAGGCEGVGGSSVWVLNRGVGSTYGYRW